ncbi:MAG: TetR/AcrR family transcriptional regulator, partial [Peptoniphilus harei]|nr:TetR/AcrR family transcriptional regulator [Peptoniphilus harei]
MNNRKLKVGEKRKLEILEAAMKCFLEKGFQNTTMEDVIEKVSLSKGGVYYHYGS